MQVDLSTFVSEPEFWFKVNAEAIKRNAPGGIYRVHAGITGREAGGFQAIPRLLKPDPLGRLYVGMASRFTGRFIELMKALDPNLLSDGHQFARSYKFLEAVSNEFPLERLRLTLRFSEAPAQAEWEELTAYRIEFGELPPFNAALPGDRSLS